VFTISIQFILTDTCSVASYFYRYAGILGGVRRPSWMPWFPWQPHPPFLCIKRITSIWAPQCYMISRQVTITFHVILPFVRTCMNNFIFFNSRLLVLKGKRIDATQLVRMSVFQRKNSHGVQYLEPLMAKPSPQQLKGIIKHGHSFFCVYPFSIISCS
jgi:hypothetical protein